MRLDDIDGKKFFPGARVTTAFGWDEGPANRASLDPSGSVWPRIHHALDLAGAGNVCCPFAPTLTKWDEDDGLGDSRLRIKGHGIEFRMLHFRREELNEETRVLILQGLPIDEGAAIGPAGDVGISFGRHVHLEIILEPGARDSELYRMLGDRWNLDRQPYYAALYKKVYTDQVKKRKVLWMNEAIVSKVDPITGREAFYIDPRHILGLI